MCITSTFVNFYANIKVFEISQRIHMLRHDALVRAENRSKNSSFQNSSLLSIYSTGALNGKSDRDWMKLLRTPE